MMRKAIIVVLALGAVACSLGWLASRLVPGERKFKTSGKANHVFELQPGCLFVVQLKRVPPSTPTSPRKEVTLGRFRLFREFLMTDHGRGPPSLCVRAISCPFWPGIILFAAYPTIVGVRGPLRRWRRRRRGCCTKCGYDLTGNTSGRCPECGKAT